MANFTVWDWKAIDQRGQVRQGATLADNRAAIEEQLFEQQLQLLSVRKSVGTRRGCWHIQQKIQVFRQLATLLQAGISLADGLALMANQHPYREWRALLQHIEQQVSQGIPFSDALRQWPRIFPPLFIALIHIGELTGKLDECSRRLADQQEQLYRLHKKVIKALRYPLFILFVAFAVTAGMLGFVLPEFAAIYRSFNASLPAITLAVMTVSSWVTSQGVVWLLGAIITAGCWLVLRQRKPSWKEYEQKFLLRIPLAASLWRGQILSQIYTTLSLSQQAGIPLLQGLVAVEQTMRPLLWKKILTQIGSRVAEGIPFWQTIDNAGCFTPLCSQLIRIGEESGALDLMLEKLAIWHHDHTQELADNLAAALEPIMMIVIGVIIGTLVIAMYLPIFQLGDAMSGG
ncbi:protein transport protein HofC [Enterobacteriaceae bacterium H18W14]|uniref:protein transport protein HofC n=1 Tax=Dryocola boscaweniae TaxID=2925397 RepID=UPI0022F0F998|nr:protein transport protein HofC [Dryocola boscaweniae]MCT4714949.1 protein transport protein HofC [Dryocola boscaweniae]